MKALALAVALIGSGLGGFAAAEPLSPDRYVENMEREHAGDTPVASEATRPAPAIEVRGAPVDYGSQGGVPLRGYLARPRAGGSGLPGVIVIHEWWGLNENIRAMSDRLAGEGYAALAVDLYGGEVADDRDGASRLARAVAADPDRARDNLRQAYATLTGAVGADRVGTLGWCFGGGWSLGAALLLPDQIDATVIYYGRLETDRAALAPLGMPILGLFGAEDRGIPIATVREFEAALRELGKPVEIHVYEGADHAFANPSGTRYQRAAAEDAWARTLAFFERYLEP